MEKLFEKLLIKTDQINWENNFNYYLVCHRKLWLYAGVRIVNRLRLVISYLTALNKQKMTMFYQYNVPDGTTKMIST